MPYVAKLGDKFSMWFCDRGGNKRRGSRGGGFCLATSTDGITWEESKENPVLKGYLVGFDPCVVKVGEVFHMWYVGHSGGGAGSFRISAATSREGIKWTKLKGDEVLKWGNEEGYPVLPLGKKGQWDSRHHAVPCVLRIGGLFFMWYLGHDGSKWRVGFATSEDGIQWTKFKNNPVLDVGQPGAWDGGSLLGHDVIFDGEAFHIWYGGVERYQLGKGHSPLRIGSARSKPLGPKTNLPR